MNILSVENFNGYFTSQTSLWGSFHSTCDRLTYTFTPGVYAVSYTHIPSVFTRKIASYSAEWQAHNVLYNIEIAIGTDFIKDRTESADLDNHDRAIKIWDFLGLEE